MRVISTRQGVITLRNDEDGSFIRVDDEGFSIYHLPNAHRNSVKTTEFKDLLEMNKALNTNCTKVLKEAVNKIKTGAPKR